MAGQTIAAAYVAIMPSFQGGAAAIQKEMDGPLGSAGEAGGKKYGGGMKTGIAGMAKSVFAPLLAIGAGVMAGQFFSGAIKEASGLNESINALNVSYGGASQGVQALGKAAATNLGLSNLEFNNLAVRFSSFSKTIAGDGGDVTKTLGDLTGRASDFASVMNLDVNEAAQLFQSGLAGESEPLRKFGIDMSAASVEAYGLANGLAANGKSLTESEKVQARYGLLMQQTAATQGDFANTSDQLANKQRITAAEFDNVKARIGTGLLPIMSALVGFVGDRILPAFETLGGGARELINAFKEGEVTSDGFAGVMGRVGLGARAIYDAFQTRVMPVLRTVAGFITGTVVPGIASLVGWLKENQAWLAPIAVGIGAMVLAYKAYQGYLLIVAAVTKAYAAAQVILNAVMTANPIGIVVLAIVGLVAALVFAYNNSETFRNIVIGVWDAIKVAASAVVGWFTGTLIPAFNSVWETVSPVLSAIGAIINWLWTNVVSPVVGFIVGYINMLGAVFTWLWENAISPAINFITGAFDAVKIAFGAVHQFFSDKVTAIGNIFSGIGDTISGAFVGVFNGIANAWNDSVGSLSWSVPGWVPVIGGDTISAPRIPLLAEGALVTNPALAMLGESGHEAVLPFSRVDEFAGMVARAMDLGPAGRRSGGRDLIDYDRLAAAMANVNLTMDGRRVSQSADAWIGASIR